MKRKLILPTVMLMAAFSLFALAGCGDATPANIQAQDTSVPSGQGGIHQISSQRAREIAVDFVGYGAVHDVLAFTDDGILTFEVDVRHNAMRYVVLVNAESGNVVRLSRYQDDTAVAYVSANDPNLDVAPDYPPHTPNLDVSPNYPSHQPATTQSTEQPAQTASSITLPSSITPRPPARAGGPANPAISAQRAVELARDHLISIGATSARFDYIYMDLERGTWVWSVEFDGSGRSYEFYVNVETGAFLQAPQGTATAASPPSSPAATATQQQVTNQTTSGQGNRPSNPEISLERAIEIAYSDLARRGINATFSRDSGMDWERGQWVWELLFRTQGERMPLIEFYINVDNGSIVKFEWDD